MHNAVYPLKQEWQDIPRPDHKGKEKVVTFLGRLTMQKGPEYFVEAANMVLHRTRNVRFCMAGSGDMMDQMIYLAAERGIADRFHFPGFMRGKQVYEAFADSDVYVMPSVSEPFGISPLEAMQCGVPSIISKQSGCAEILDKCIKTDYWDINAMADAMYDDEIQAMILNEGYISLLTEQEPYSDFSDRTKIIYEYVTKQEITSIKPSGSITKQPFVIYCSGSDERDSDINAKSRSDVNILAVVNPKTRQILLVNTPRDYYLPLAFNGELDKLTHAGMYGVQESMAVLDNLYGTKTSYYGRINFWGLIDIVDALGGIDVYSDFAFTTDAGDVRGYGYNEYSYTEGWNHMNGIEALTFSRERYSFSDGDNQRGKNQMKVIQAIIEKATSPSVLANYQDLLKAVSDNFITNISYDQISSLVQMMQKNGASWNIQTMSATQGSGDTMQPCYSAYGELLYVMPPDYDSVNRIREVIDQVMNGEEIVLPAE